MNEKVLRHKKICDGLNELYARKNHDYGDSFHTTFVEEGLAMARIRLGATSSRLRMNPFVIRCSTSQTMPS